MMIFQKIKFTRNKISAIIIFIFLLLFLIFFRQIRYFSINTRVALDNKIFFAKSSINNFFGTFKNKQDLIDENNRLLKTVSEYEANLSNYKALKIENERMSHSQNNRIKSRVLSKGELTNGSKIIIENNDFSIKNKVYSGSVFLGYIGESFDGKSVLELQSKSGYKINAMTENGKEVVLSGEGNQTFSFEVLSEESIEIGQVVREIGTSSIICVVKKINIDPKTPYKTIYATYPLNLNYLDFVDVNKDE